MILKFLRRLLQRTLQSLLIIVKKIKTLNKQVVLLSNLCYYPFMDSINAEYEAIETLIGKDNALKLLEMFQGSCVYFPKKVLIERKHQDLLNDFKRGLSYRQLAQKYGYSEPHVRFICNYKPNTSIVHQPCLF